MALKVGNFEAKATVPPLYFDIKTSSSSQEKKDVP